MFNTVLRLKTSISAMVSLLLVPNQRRSLWAVIIKIIILKRDELNAVLI